MNPIVETGIVVRRELQKNLRSAKGLLLLALSAFGGTGSALIMVRSIQEKIARAEPDEVIFVKEQLFTYFYQNQGTAKFLSAAPIALVPLLYLGVWLLPLLVALVAFDGVAGELQHRSARYWLVRTRRSSYYVGKFLGAWGTVLVITLCMNMLMWAVTILRGFEPLGSTLSWGLRFWLVSTPIAAAWCAIATFVSAFFRTPALSLFTTLAVFFAVWGVGFFLANLTQTEWLTYLYPNSYDGFMLSPEIKRRAMGLGFASAWIVLMCGLGNLLFARRDV